MVTTITATTVRIDCSRAGVVSVAVAAEQHWVVAPLIELGDLILHLNIVVLHNLRAILLTCFCHDHHVLPLLM
jgi:hypothetical protein